MQANHATIAALNMKLDALKQLWALAQAGDASAASSAEPQTKETTKEFTKAGYLTKLGGESEHTLCHARTHIVPCTYAWALGSMLQSDLDRALFSSPPPLPRRHN